MTLQTMQVLSAVLGLVGGVILAFSLNSVLNATRLGIDAVATSIESFAAGGHVYVFRGLDEQLRKAGRIANSWVRAGLYCLIASAVLAVLTACGVNI
ncbi:hypothetical protein M4D49_29410 [Cupriavidus pauculus]|uniref:hypothetical protein n=1 Tax=Cupriavidus TaxID=106589 RepID=UPI000493AD49|nr:MULTISPECIES: hypothetical protein [Cupriavidus]MCM3609583.1 hypothetical protein [Cupriavidus pauculus]